MDNEEKTTHAMVVKFANPLFYGIVKKSNTKWIKKSLKNHSIKEVTPQGNAKQIRVVQVYGVSVTKTMPLKEIEACLKTWKSKRRQFVKTPVN